MSADIGRVDKMRPGSLIEEGARQTITGRPTATVTTINRIGAVRPRNSLHARQVRKPQTMY
jgi:hypothetical protein